MPQKGYKQTKEHKEKHLLTIKGERNGSWKGGIKSINPKEYYRKYHKTWKEKNRNKVRENNRATRHKRRAAIGSFTRGEWELLKRQYGYKCPACKKEVELTVDHIIPLSKGGSNYIENIQPLCMPCNREKFIKIVKYELSG